MPLPQGSNRSSAAFVLKLTQDFVCRALKARQWLGLA